VLLDKREQRVKIVFQESTVLVLILSQQSATTVQLDSTKEVTDKVHVYHVFQVNLMMNLQWKSAKSVQQTLLQISQSRSHVRIVQQGKLHWQKVQHAIHVLLDKQEQHVKIVIKASTVLVLTFSLPSATTAQQGSIKEVNDKVLVYHVFQVNLMMNLERKHVKVVQTTSTSPMQQL
jgi:hypothetical protein